LITPQSYSQSLSKSEKLVSDKVRAYIREPSEENVHDLRTSVRRLLTAANVLPKKIRRQREFKRHLESYAKLLRLNAKVRDVDIILAKLPNHGDDPNLSILATQLKEIRESPLKRAKRFASSIKDKTDVIVEARELSSPLIQKRFRKTTQFSHQNAENTSPDGRQRTRKPGRATQAERRLSKFTLHTRNG
jgi:CHAD domain-containing protein